MNGIHGLGIGYVRKFLRPSAMKIQHISLDTGLSFGSQLKKGNPLVGRIRIFFQKMSGLQLLYQLGDAGSGDIQPGAHIPYPAASAAQPYLMNGVQYMDMTGLHPFRKFRQCFRDPLRQKTGIQQLFES